MQSVDRWRNGGRPRLVCELTLQVAHNSFFFVRWKLVSPYEGYGGPERYDYDYDYNYDYNYDYAT